MNHIVLIKKHYFVWKVNQQMPKVVPAGLALKVITFYSSFVLLQFYEGVDPGLLFQLSHSNTAPIVFRTDSASATEK